MNFTLAAAVVVAVAVAAAALGAVIVHVQTVVQGRLLQAAGPKLHKGWTACSTAAKAATAAAAQRARQKKVCCGAPIQHGRPHPPACVSGQAVPASSAGVQETSMQGSVHPQPTSDLLAANLQELLRSAVTAAVLSAQQGAGSATTATAAAAASVKTASTGAAGSLKLWANTTAAASQTWAQQMQVQASLPMACHLGFWPQPAEELHGVPPLHRLLDLSHVSLH